MSGTVLSFCHSKIRVDTSENFSHAGVSLCQNNFERVGGRRSFACAQMHFSIMRRERQGEACVINIVGRQVRKH